MGLKLQEPEPFAVAGPGTGGIFYLERESQRELICSPDPGSVRVELELELELQGRSF